MLLRLLHMLAVIVVLFSGWSQAKVKPQSKSVRPHAPTKQRIGPPMVAMLVGRATRHSVKSIGIM